MDRDIKKNLDEIIELHSKWLDNQPDGKRADFSNADLKKINLSGATFIIVICLNLRPTRGWTS